MSYFSVYARCFFSVFKANGTRPICTENENAGSSILHGPTTNSAVFIKHYN